MSSNKLNTWKIYVCYLCSRMSYMLIAVYQCMHLAVASYLFRSSINFQQQHQFNIADLFC